MSLGSNLRCTALAACTALLATASSAQVPKLSPFDRTLDVLVVDSAFDGVWRLMDLNQDGDFHDAGEIIEFYSDLIGLHPLTNPACIGIGADGTAYLADSTVDIVLAMRDMNGNGDANDPGEAWVFFDVNNGSGITVASAQGITVDAAGVVWLANAGTTGGGNDAIVRLADGNGDNDANDPGEAIEYYLPAPGSGTVGDSIPTDIRVGNANDLYYTEAGTTGVIQKGVYRLHDDVTPNGHVNDPGEVDTYWVASNAASNPFYWGLELGSDGVMYVTDHGNERVYRLEDRNGNGTIDAGQPEEVVYYQNPGASTMWDVLLRDDGAILICEDQTPDRLVLHVDLDGSGVIDQPNETVNVYDSTVSSFAIKPRGAVFMRGPSIHTSPNPVALGSAVQIQLGGQPGNLVGLFAAVFASPVPLPIPPFGYLELDPLTLSPLVQTTLNGQGEAQLGANIPNDPFLVGTFPLQAFALDPFRSQTSNLELLVIQ